MNYDCYRQFFIIFNDAYSINLWPLLSILDDGINFSVAFYIYYITMPIIWKVT